MESTVNPRRLGFWEGMGSMADDFNETPAEVFESFEVSPLAHPLWDGPACLDVDEYGGSSDRERGDSRKIFE